MRRSTDRRKCLALLAAATLPLPRAARAADPLAVEVVNASVPTLCAETDNVYLQFLSAQVRRFKVIAEHPPYAGTIVVDRSAPDFQHCDMSGDPVFKAEPRRVTLYETGGLQLLGYTFLSFWRPNTVPVRVGQRVENGLHLLQLFTKYRQRTEEVLVVYPPDGYWRARPLPPPHLGYSAYGSSLLVGPVEPSARPFVDIREIAFDPATLTFRLALARAGTATLHVEAVDEEHIEIAIGLDPAVAPPLPFAALRSMFVTETNADVAQVSWRTPGGKAYEVAPIMSFQRADALELWAGRRLRDRPGDGLPPRRGHRVPRRPPPPVPPQHERARHGVAGFRWGPPVARMSEATFGKGAGTDRDSAPAYGLRSCGLRGPNTFGFERHGQACPGHPNRVARPCRIYRGRRDKPGDDRGV
jgi:hypothetical protein